MKFFGACGPRRATRFDGGSQFLSTNRSNMTIRGAISVKNKNKLLLHSNLKLEVE